jgi:predicted aspartyl protease
MRIAPLVLLLTSLALSGCMSRPPRLDQPPKETTLSADRVDLPAIFIGGRPCVDLTVNGQGPYRFILDTGAEGTSISPQVAREARISRSRRYVARIWGAGGQSQRAYLGTVNRIESPHFSLREISVTILSAENMAQMSAHGEINGGILGLSALREVLLEIDFPRQTVSLLRPGSAWPPSETGLPYTGSTPHVTIATPSTRHATTDILIDTGSSSGFLLADIASYPVRVGLTKADEYTFGIGAYWRPLFGQLAGDIRLGPATWRDAEIRSADENTLGSAALAPWKLVIDQKRRRLWLLDEIMISTTKWTGPLEPDGRPAVYGFVGVPDGDAILIKEVDPGSRAERAGLKAGDRYRWENTGTTTTGTVAGPAPLQVRLRVIRGSENFEITMSLLDPLPAIAPPAAAVFRGKAAGGQN